MELKSLFGLPAHPLVVHAAVVLLPLAVLSVLAATAWPRGRRSYAPVALGLALLATFAVLLAQGSGEELEDQVKETELVEEHTDAGETVLPWAIAVTVVAGATVLAGPAQRHLPRVPARKVTAGLVAAALITGAGATWTIVEVGHSGAKATWDSVPNANQER